MKDLHSLPDSPSGAVLPRLERVSDAAGLARLRPDWEALLAQDPASGVFMSHDWLAPALLANPGRWCIYLLRDGAGRPLCLFPLKQRLHWSRSAGEFQTEYAAAGRLAWGEYTGFVCPPEREEEALPALSRALAGEPWKSLSLRYEPTGRRARLFAEGLGPDFRHRFRSYRINGGTVDNLVSLQLPLEGSFDDLLATRLSANSRQKIRRARRRMLQEGPYRLRTATPETVERDIALLLRNWVAQWGPQRGRKKMLEVAERYGRALLTAEAAGQLYLPQLWEGERLLGALGHVIDAQRGIVHFLVAGRDVAARDPAIGLLLHAEAIEWSLAAGNRLYDFGHGDQPYKLSFGPDRHETHYLTVRREGEGPVLDETALGPALKRLEAFAQEGQTERLVAGISQLAARFGAQ